MARLVGGGHYLKTNVLFLVFALVWSELFLATWRILGKKESIAEPTPMISRIDSRTGCRYRKRKFRGRGGIPGQSNTKYR